MVVTVDAASNGVWVGVEERADVDEGKWVVEVVGGEVGEDLIVVGGVVEVEEGAFEDGEGEFRFGGEGALWIDQRGEEARACEMGLRVGEREGLSAPVG